MTIDRISEAWCKTMHRNVMWPINGKYICPQCMREYAVCWSEPAIFAAASQARNGRELSISSTAQASIR